MVHIARGPLIKNKTAGFTIVELLIVIVVIGILAAITIVSYSNIQIRARDSVRSSDISTITKALEMYYVDHGSYPVISGGSTQINVSWATTADASWSVLSSSLNPYLSQMPHDSVSTQGVDPRLTAGALDYSYYANTISYCGVAIGQMYILVYRFEQQSQVNTYIGDCSTNPLSYSGSSNYRVVK